MVVLKRTVIDDNDWRVDSLSGSHHRMGSSLCQKFSPKLCELAFINNLITYLLILRSAKFTIRSLITEPYNKLIDRFMLFLLRFIWRKMCRSYGTFTCGVNYASSVRSAALYTLSSSPPSGTPGSVRVSKISWTSIPVQCQSNAFLRAAAVIPRPST